MFFWIFAVIALLLAFAPPRYRKIGFAVVSVVFLVFVAIVLVNRRPLPGDIPAAPVPSPAVPTSRRFDFDAYQRDKRDKADPEAKTRIAVSEIRLDQLQAIAGLEPGTLQAVHARLYNDSRQFTLTDYTYYLVVQDCLPATTRSATLEALSVSGIAASTSAPALAPRPTATSAPTASKNANDGAADRCTTVYDQRDSASLTVPPNQARDIAISIPTNAAGSAAPFKLLGTPRIELKAMDTRAYQ